MVTNPQTNGAATEYSACNPESAVTNPAIQLSAVLRLIEQIQLAHGQCVAAFESHARPDLRGAAAISRGIFAAMETLGERVRAIPAVVSDSDLMLEALVDDLRDKRAESRARRRHFGFRMNEPSEPHPQLCLAEWNRSDALEIFLDDLLSDYFSGNAEEQPEPREESRPSIGKSPVTAAGANPPRPLPPGKVQAYAETNGLPPRPCPHLEPWLDSAKTSEVEATLEVILLELHCRGRDFRPSETAHPYLFNRRKR